MTEVDRMGKFHKAIELQGSGTFLLAVNIVGHGAPTEHTEAEPGMIYMDVDSENGDLYKCIKVTITEQGSIWLWKKLVESQELEILKKEIATKANKTGWTANKYLGTDADGNMVEKEAPQTGTGGITEETDPTVPAWAKEPEKPTYTASEVGALPASTEIPANTSDLNNDSGYITIAVATLLNYYLKTEVYAKAETYSQTEVDNLISGLDKRLNAIADSEDVDLDQFSELVAYIKANKSMIDSITTSKVNVADIIDNLTTADSKKPLSAAQGKALKAMYDALPAWAKASTKPTYTKSEVGLGNVDNVRQYSASNPPPYPVKSVNGKTGAVTLGAADVGAATAEQLERLSGAIADQQTEIDGKQPKGNYALSSELAAEVTAREQAVESLNARLGQQTVLIAVGETQEEAEAWLETNADKTKVYLMPDDTFWQYKKTTEVVEGGIAYTNRLPLATTEVNGTTIYGGDYNSDGTPDGYQTNTRLSGSSGSANTAGTGKEAMCSSGFIFPVSAGDILRIKGITPVTSSNHYVVGYDSTGARTGNDTIVFAQDTDGSLIWTVSSSSGKYTIDDDGTIAYTINTAKLGANVSAVRICAGMDENTIVTLNEEIKEGGGTTTTVIVEKWVSTGHGLVATNYDVIFAELRNITDAHTAEINELKAAVDGSSPLTDAEKLERIKTWDVPIYDANIPIFELSAEKAAITETEKTVDAVYAKYDALMTKHPNYITKTNLGMCSDGVTPVYRYDFREPEPHRGVTGAKEWSESKAKAIIVSGIHWEWGGIFALYNALEEIAENPNLYSIRRNTHLIVLPVCNPYAVANMSVRNANLIEIHRNFEVDFIYPGEPGYIELGERSHGGTEPLSEVETQYIDDIFRDNTDAALFLTCHSNQSDSVYGTGFTWASPATYYMCNMHYRIVDKLSAVWMEKYGDELAAGIADYRTENTPEWDNRLGSAYLSTTNGTETKQATKYGIQATNIEITDAFLVHGTKANPEPALSSFTMSRGAEVYVNFLLTAFGVYDYKDKEQYYK